MSYEPSFELETIETHAPAFLSLTYSISKSNNITFNITTNNLINTSNIQTIDTYCEHP